VGGLLGHPVKGMGIVETDLIARVLKKGNPLIGKF
jgi:hypothetical protein